MKIDKSSFQKNIPGHKNPGTIDNAYRSSRPVKLKPVFILDDDPTGIQTTHDLDLYTVWDTQSIDEIFRDKKAAFIQTNTRAFTEEKVRGILLEIMNNILQMAEYYDSDFEIISRSDSTLRGHFPLETEIINSEIIQKTGRSLDGEILIPFFPEGGRFTYRNTHWVFDGDFYLPAAETEFASDPDFGYRNSDLTAYIEEKTRGAYRADDVRCISLDMIRNHDIAGILAILMEVRDFQKVVVNALDYNDLKIFITALNKALSNGKKFTYRTAASFVKVFTYNEDIPLLTGRDIIVSPSVKGKTLLLAGSYTGKTSSQLDHLMHSRDVFPIEISVTALIEKRSSRESEIQRLIQVCDQCLFEGGNPVLFTSRTLITGDNHLETGSIISDSLVRIISDLKQRPEIIITKGGITSSDIISRALMIKKAKVKGQIIPGVPVISAGSESKWPGIPCIIFPGNVGNQESLMEIYKALSALENS